MRNTRRVSTPSPLQLLLRSALLFVLILGWVSCSRLPTPYGGTQQVPEITLLLAHSTKAALVHERNDRAAAVASDGKRSPPSRPSTTFTAAFGTLWPKSPPLRESAPLVLQGSEIPRVIAIHRRIPRLGDEPPWC
ncbi:MAG TPA: hypothetical protein VFQ61_03165 [Polyangiaceae bacterium]|nr:hypothetical protein [Polyangiaceae bacterium]